MHYRNGREAKNGDTVIGKPIHGASNIVGIIQDIQPGCVSCNSTVIRPAGMIQPCVTVGDMLHIDDVMDFLNKTVYSEKEPDLMGAVLAFRKQ